MRDRDSPAEVGATARPPDEREPARAPSASASSAPSSGSAAPARWASWITHHLGQIGNAFAFVFLIAWLVFAALILTLRYIVFPHVNDYRESIENYASRALGEPVKIGAIDASWRGLRPTLSLSAIRIVDHEGNNALELPMIRATFSWNTLVVMDLRLASLEIDGPDLAVRRDAEGQLFIAGYPIKKKASPDNRVAEWILAQNEIRIRHARITWRDEMPKAETNASSAANTSPPASAPARPVIDLAFSDVDIALVRSGWRHRFALHATPPAMLAAPLDAPLDIRGVIDHPLFASRLAEPATWRGELYANVASADLMAWRAWLPLPDRADRIESGRGRMRAWMRFASADHPAGSFAHRLAESKERPVPSALDRLADVTADLALDDVAVRWGASEPGASNRLALAAIDGRIAMSQTQQSQKLSARKLALRPQSGAALAPTDLDVERTLGDKKEDESGSASVSAVDIGTIVGLVPAAALPPAVAEKLAALRPRGALDRVAYKWSGPIASPATFQFNARFARLAIAAQAPTPEAIKVAAAATVAPNGLVKKPRPAFGQPGFENFAGTLSASRATDAGGATTRATINLRSIDASVMAPGLFDDPLLRLARLDADVGVQM